MLARRTIKLLVPILSAWALTACANLHSIHHEFAIPKDRTKIVTIDAKQRAIISALDTENGKKVAKICSEPPPDVFTALATSLGISASAALPGAAAADQNKKLAARFGLTMAENASAINRTQTVNLLRDMMFNTCMRYLSGAIDSNNFIVQAARDQRAMVAMLAIEQMTGVQYASANALTTQAALQSGITTEATIKILDDAKKKMDGSAMQAAAKRAAARDMPPKDKDCAAITAAKPAPDSSTVEGQKLQACTQADALEKTSKQDAAHYAALKDALSKQSGGGGRSGGSAVMQAGAQQAPVSIGIANAVKEIVLANNNFPELRMTCVVLLRRNSGKNSTTDSTPKSTPKSTTDSTTDSDTDEKFYNACVDLIVQDVNTEISELKYTESETNHKANLMSNESLEKDAKIIWNYFASDAVTNVKLKTLIDKMKNDGVTVDGPDFAGWELSNQWRVNSAIAFGKGPLAAMSPSDRHKMSLYVLEHPKPQGEAK